MSTEPQSIPSPTLDSLLAYTSLAMFPLLNADDQSNDDEARFKMNIDVATRVTRELIDKLGNMLGNISEENRLVFESCGQEPKNCVTRTIKEEPEGDSTVYTLEVTGTPGFDYLNHKVSTTVSRSPMIQDIDPPNFRDVPSCVYKE